MAFVKPIPDGYQAITPYLISHNAALLIDFYKAAFGATERLRMPGENGRIGHAELDFNGAVIMLADEEPMRNARSPQQVGGSPVSLVLYVTDVDAVIERAVGLGAKLVSPAADQFYGDRMGSLTDPDGYTWHVATHIEDVSAEELKRRAAALAP